MDRNSWTALMWAQSMRHSGVVDILKEFNDKA
jgi:hypothetical protein